MHQRRPSLCPSLLLAAFTLAGPARADHAIYTDSLQSSWENWSWSTTVNLANSSPVHAGSRSVGITMTSAWAGFSLHHADMDTSPYESLTFWIHGGGAGGQRLRIYAEFGGTTGPSQDLPVLPANTWQKLTFSFASLGIVGQPGFNRFTLQDRSGAAQAAFYVDDLALVSSSTPPPAITLSSPTNGAGYLPPANIVLAATVTTNSHVINRIQFLNGTNVLNEDSTAPFTYTWTNVPAGSYSLAARLVYDNTNTLSSIAASVSVISNAPVTVTVNTLGTRRPISPLIYGTAFATSNQLRELNFTVNRSGGNAETRYNWLINARNHAADWYFESLSSGAATPGAAANDHIANSRNGSAEAMVTVPMIGWMPKLGPNRGKLASYSIAKYGPQTGSDAQWMPDAGNGISVTNNTLITWNDPADAHFLTNSAFQRAWLQTLTNRWGLASQGGVRFYCMDNEHTLWHSTHRDVHPVGTTMQEIRDKFFDYAAMVKDVNPSALILAPEEWGWSGYLYSGYDQQWAGAHSDWNPAHYPDRATNGGWDYLPWFLDQARRQATNTQRRLLDYFTLHIYPQEANQFTDDVSTATQLGRNRSTRALWDTGYVDQSWINTAMQLIPRMRNWVTNYYPGTPIGITEYNWGAEGHINGATAQADILGIFGREGVDLATRWTTPDSATPTFKAMKLYRNYDGNRSTFGDISVSAGGPNPDNVAAFAALRSADAALTVMVVNKQLMGTQPLVLNLPNFPAVSPAQAWQLTSANTITRLPDTSVSSGTLTNVLPAQSITLFVVPARSPTLRASADSNLSMSLQLQGVAGLTYQLETCEDLGTWQLHSTHTPVTNSLTLTVPTTNSASTFYRARLK